MAALSFCYCNESQDFGYLGSVARSFAMLRSLIEFTILGKPINILNYYVYPLW